MQNYIKESKLPVSADVAFAWHERDGALPRLIPPWENVSLDSRTGGIGDGAKVNLVNKIGPIKLPWHAEHSDYQQGRQFRDTQAKGPFAHWVHTHSFEPIDESNCVLKDAIEYRLPAGFLGNAFGGGLVRSKVDRMFRYRHEVTKQDLVAHAKYKDKGTMKIAITGATGLVGGELAAFLNAGGHEVIPISRSKQENGIQWDPAKGEIDADALEGVDAVVHLAGENIAAGRWNDAMKKRIRDSRVNGTKLIAETVAKLENKPKVLVCASAIGFYGDRGDDIMTEESSVGDDFLAEVCQEWEEASVAAEEAGIRVPKMRIGVVLSPKGGALQKMLTPFKLCAGGIVGNGKQYWSWVALDDVVGALHHAIMNDDLSGPINTVAPNAPTNREFTKTLGKVLGRPTIFPMPGFAAKIALGEMAEALLLASTRVAPNRLEESGYEFRLPDLEQALRHLLGK